VLRMRVIERSIRTGRDSARRAPAALPLGPYTAASELVSRHELAGPLQQQRENLEWLVLKREANTGFAQFPGIDVELEHTQSDDCVGT
jgi:hypothetical protein